MLLELRLQQWIEEGLKRYKSQPILSQLVFSDSSHLGYPDGLGDGVLSDSTKRWLPDEHAGGQVWYSGVTFPILSNTTDGVLTITGDPSLLTDADRFGFRIIPPTAIRLMDLLATKPLPVVLTKYAPDPTEMPCFTVSLQSDQQRLEDTFIGEEIEQRVDNTTGLEYRMNLQYLQASYLISIWSANRLETLWLYAWLTNWFHSPWSQELFAAWGMDHVLMGGMDRDPAVEYMPERVYVRHFLLEARRAERSFDVPQLEEITDWNVFVLMQYAPFFTPLFMT